jgi:hypothetical protein
MKKFVYFHSPYFCTFNVCGGNAMARHQHLSNANSASRRFLAG